MKNWMRFFLFVGGFSTLVMAENAPYSGHIESSYERLYLPGKEPMGLLRVGALFDVNDYLAIGPELYGAVYGQRGGFITVGMEGKMHRSLTHRLAATAGLYVGAGGGGSAPQGGGLMLRPSLGIAYDLGAASIEAGVSRVWYPNGRIDSTQLHAGISVPFSGRFWEGHAFDHHGTSEVKSESLGVTTHALVEHYLPVSTAHNAHSAVPTTPYTLAGVEFVIGSRSWYGVFQAAGAGAGKSTGYMELFGGAGYRLQLSDYLSLGLQGAIGAGGGGRVDTGGGLMYRTDAVADVRVMDRLHLSVRAGKIGSISGSFSATSYGVTLGYEERFFGLGDPDFISSDANLTAWRFRVMNKSYLPAKGMFNDGKVNRIDLIGIALNRFVSPNIYLTGESFWAWQGKAGGYAEGVFGLGYQTDRYHGFRLYGEALAGVGGGGSVHMEGGFFGSIGGGITYDINDATQLYLGAAFVRSKAGGFRTKSIDFGVQYNFSLFSRVMPPTTPIESRKRGCAIAHHRQMKQKKGKI